MDRVTTAPYPDPPRCCEHTSNAHSRKHCLLCDCEKAPTVNYPQQPPAPSPDDIDVTVLDACGLCHAVVADLARHLDWHERVVNTLESVANALSRIAPKETSRD